MSKENAKPDNKDEVTTDDLDLIPEGLEDEAKDDEELWNEIDAEESGADTEAADDEPAADAADDEPASDDEPETGDNDAGDPWAGATPEQKAAFEAAQNQAKTLQHQLDSEKGRTKTYRRQLSDVTRQLDRVAVNKQPPNDDNDDGNTDDGKPDSWDTLATEYPEVAEPLNERLSEIEKRQARLDKREADEAQAAQDEHDRLVEQQTALLETEHPDWLAAATDPEFDAWLDDQPRKIRDVAQQNAKEIVDAKGAGDIIARYKASRSDQSGNNSGGPDNDSQETVTSLAEKRARQLESSTGARPRGPGTVVQGVPEDGDEEEIWNAFDKKEAREAAKA